VQSHLGFVERAHREGREQVTSLPGAGREGRDEERSGLLALDVQPASGRRWSHCSNRSGLLAFHDFARLGPRPAGSKTSMSLPDLGVTPNQTKSKSGLGLGTTAQCGLLAFHGFGRLASRLAEPDLGVTPNQIKIVAGQTSSTWTPTCPRGTPNLSKSVPNQCRSFQTKPPNQCRSFGGFAERQQQFLSEGVRSRYVPRLYARNGLPPVSR